MGQIPNRIYKAPDGSLFRIEDDGSLTKIVSGSAEKPNPQPKYHVMDDGKKYRINDDGSFTLVDDAEERTSSPNGDVPSNDDTSNGSKKWAFWMFVVLIILLVGVVFVVNNNSSSHSGSYQDYEQKAEEVYTEEAAQVEAAEAPAAATAEAVEPAYGTAPVAFDGYFYGDVGNASVSGYMGGLDAKNPSGWVYYESGGSDTSLSLESSYDGMTWTEYLDGRITGVWYLDYLDLSNRNFARGTFVREYDGKQFSFNLYMSNY